MMIVIAQAFTHTRVLAVKLLIISEPVTTLELHFTCVYMIKSINI